MIPDHLKPSMTYTPAEPRKVLPPGEEGVPLHRIDRQLWPGMTSVRYGGQAKPQAEWGAGLDDPEIPEIPACVPAAGGAGHAAPMTDPDPCVSASLCDPTDGSTEVQSGAPGDAPAPTCERSLPRTDIDVYRAMERKPLPECVTSRAKKTLPECFALAESRPKRRSPTEKERQVMLEALLQREMPTGEPQSPTDESGKVRTGRPPKIVGQRRKFMLHALGLGLTRSEVARRLAISPATISKLLHRDRELAAEVSAAERDGANFRRIYEKIFLPGYMVLERHPQLGTLYFEQEKEYLIAKGLPRGWVRRLRVRDLEEWCEEMNAEQAREKALVRVEKELAKLERPERKSRRVVKIVRREFSKRDGRPVEEIRYTVEQRGAGRLATRPFAELEGLPEL